MSEYFEFDEFPKPSAPLTDGEVTLRPWTMADAMALEPACGDVDICKFTTVPWRYSPADAIDWIQRQEAKRKEGVTIALAITRAGDNRALGTVSVSDPVREEKRAALGYWVIAPERRKGLAARGAALARDWAFGELGFEELELEIEPGNEGSAALARKLGAEPTGEQRMGELHGVTHVLDLWRIRAQSTAGAGQAT